MQSMRPSGEGARPLDTRTRWNSTYAMIKRACELREPLRRMGEIRPDLPNLSNDEWERVEAVAHVLGIFDEATLMLCGTNYPTLNAAVPIYNQLFNELEDFGDACDDKEKDAILGQWRARTPSMLSRRPFRPGGPWQARRVLREDPGRYGCDRSDSRSKAQAGLL